MFVVAVAAAVAGLAVAYRGSVVAKSPPPTKQRENKVMSDKKYTKPAADEIKKKLTSEQYEVTQACGTEPPFHNAFWDNHKPGLYVDVVTGEPLFSSTDNSIRVPGGRASRGPSSPTGSRRRTTAATG